MSALRIAMGADVILAGQLNDAPSAQALGAALPVGGDAALWGRAICFAAPLAVHPDDPQAPNGSCRRHCVLAARPSDMPVLGRRARQR